MNSQEEIDNKYFDHYFHSINLLFYSIVGVSLLFFVVIFLNIKETGGLNPSFTENEPSWYYLGAVICLLLIFPAYIFYKKKIVQARNEKLIRQKLIMFRKASMIKYALLEAGNLLALLLLFFTEEQLFFVVYAIMLTVFTINRPTPYRVAKDLELTAEEKEMIRNYKKL